MNTKLPEATQMDAVRRVANHAELDSVRCREFSATLHTDDLRGTNMRAEVSYQVGTRAPDAGVLEVRVHAVLRIVHGMNDHDVEVATVDTLHDLRYLLDEGADLEQEDLDAFAQLNAVYNAWPYLREAFQTGTTRLGVEPFVLQLLKVDGRQDTSRKG